MWRRDQRAAQPSFRRSAKDRARATIRHSVLRLRLLSFKWWAPNHDNNNTKPDGYMAIRCAPEPFRRPIAECASRIFGSHASRRTSLRVAPSQDTNTHTHAHSLLTVTQVFALSAHHELAHCFFFVFVCCCVCELAWRRANSYIYALSLLAGYTGVREVICGETTTKCVDSISRMLLPGCLRAAWCFVVTRLQRAIDYRLK